jgi:hypothetical protein
VFVSLDAALQEEPLPAPVPLPPLDRFPPAMPAAATEEAIRQTAHVLASAQRPLIMIGRVCIDPADFERRVALAQRLGAVVLTDIKTGATFPTQHPLHPYPPSLYVTGDATQAIRDADAILSLDWIDLGGTLRQACGGALPGGKILQCSLDQYVHNGWSMDTGAAARRSGDPRAARCAGRRCLLQPCARRRRGRGPSSRRRKLRRQRSNEPAASGRLPSPTLARHDGTLAARPSYSTA